MYGCRGESIGRLLEPLACRLIARMRKLADRRAGNDVHYRMRTDPGLGMRADLRVAVGVLSALLFVELQR